MKRYPQGQMFSVTLGLGRLANHYTRTISLKMQCAQTAEMKAKNIFRADLEKEIGKNDPIWNKILTVVEVVEIPNELVSVPKAWNDETALPDDAQEVLKSFRKLAA